MAGSPHRDRTSSQRAESRGHYCIKVLGRIGTPWSTWFDGLKVTPGEGVTVIEGTVDQASLRGILSRIWDLNLTLVSIARNDAGEKSRRAAQNE